MVEREPLDRRATGSTESEQDDACGVGLQREPDEVVPEGLAIVDEVRIGVRFGRGVIDPRSGFVEPCLGAHEALLGFTHGAEHEFHPLAVLGSERAHESFCLCVDLVEKAATGLELVHLRCDFSGVAAGKKLAEKGRIAALRRDWDAFFIPEKSRGPHPG